MLGEFGELLPQGVAALPLGGLEVCDGRINPFLNLINYLGSNALGGNFLGDSTLKFLDADARHHAFALQLRRADVVLVGAAAACVLAVDQAAGAPHFVTLAAKDETFEVVEVDAVPVAAPGTGAQDLSYLQVEPFRDERFMASRVELSLVLDRSCVIRIVEDARESGRRQRRRAKFPRGSGRQPVLFEGSRQTADRVLASRVLLESPDDEWCAHWIDVDRVHQSPIEVLADVEVAELRTSNASAALDLVSELELDVLTTHPDLKFVHHICDRFHGVAHVSLAELLLGRDELDAALVEIAFRDCRIDEVSEYARSHVDDDVLHLGMVGDVLHHLFEDGPL